MIADFRRGLTFWLHGWGYIFDHRKLLLVSILPILIAFASCVFVMWVVWTHLGLWVNQLIGAVIGASTGLWHDFVYYPLVLGGGVLVLVATVYVAFLLHNLIAVPFYSLLADRTLAQLGKKPAGLGWRMTMRLIRVSAVKTVLFLILGLFLFVFSFIPLLNILAMLCALLILAFDCMDYAFDGVGFGFRQRLGYLLREWPQWFGMAAALALTLLIPGLTLLVIPGAVVGSALILKERK